MCTGDIGLNSLAHMLEGCCIGCRVLWVGAGEVLMVGDVQEAEGEERGSWARSSPSPPLLMAQVRAEGAGVDQVGLHKHGYSHWAKKNSDAHSD
jgi:hypothetical protein